MTTSTTRRRAGRRMNGEGAVYFDKSKGRWVGALSIGGRRRKVIANTRADALTRLRTLRRQMEDGLPVGDGSVTVGQWLDHWLTNVLPARATSPNTVDNYTTIATCHLKPVLGGNRLRSLSPEHVEALLRDRAEKGYSRNSVMRMRAVLGMALRHAEKKGRVARNVASLADMPTCRPKKDRRTLQPHQWSTLRHAAAGDRLEAAWLAGMMLGLRPGEITGLLWENIDLAAGVLHVRTSLKRERLADAASGKRVERLRLGDLKTPRARRSLNMPAPLVDALRHHRALQAAERLAAGDAWSSEWADAGLVFTTQVGTPLDPANVRRVFNRVTDAAGIGRWTPYELRHSVASLLSYDGIHAEVIGDLLGHDGTRMVAGVYRHAVAPTVAAAVAPMERRFASTGTD